MNWHNVAILYTAVMAVVAFVAWLVVSDRVDSDSRKAVPLTIAISGTVAALTLLTALVGQII